MSREREFSDRGVSIPMSLVVSGSKQAVLAHLRDGLGQAEQDLETADDLLAAAKTELERCDLHFARKEQLAVAWRTAYDAAKRAFGAEAEGLPLE